MTVCYYDEFTCRYWPDPEQLKHYCYSRVDGSYVSEEKLPVGYNMVSVATADSLTDESEDDNEVDQDGRDTTNNRTDIPIYGLAAAAYVAFGTWWPMIMAWIIVQINPSSFMIELYDKACAWSLLGPFAGNWAVLAYHYFKAEELEPSFRPQQLVFPGVWLLITGLMMWFQLELYPFVGWWIILHWEGAVILEDDIAQEETDRHSITPIHDEEIPSSEHEPEEEEQGPFEPHDTPEEKSDADEWNPVEPSTDDDTPYHPYREPTEEE
jgi:hypothetical protein